MANYFDISDTNWQRCKEEMLSILRSVASKGQMIAYSDLSNKVKTLYLDPRGQPMSEMLGEVAEEENLAGRGLLSVVVVHKNGDKKPGKGIYVLAEKLGRDTSDEDNLWITEIRRVWFCCGYTE